jgi:hypothetical protein
VYIPFFGLIRAYICYGSVLDTASTIIVLAVGNRCRKELKARLECLAERMLLFLVFCNACKHYHRACSRQSVAEGTLSTIRVLSRADVTLFGVLYACKHYNRACSRQSVAEGALSTIRVLSRADVTLFGVL